MLFRSCVNGNIRIGQHKSSSAKRTPLGSFTSHNISLWGPERWCKWLKVLALHAPDPIWAPVLIPAAPLPFQLPACGPGKQWRTAQSLGTLHPRGRPGSVSWLWVGIAWALALPWGANHQTEDLPLCLSSLYIHLSNEKIIKINLKKIKKRNSPKR